MFSSPSFRVFSQSHENKDALMARKLGNSNSARKPLADRAVNESKSFKPESTKQSLKKPSMPAKKASPKKNDYPDWLMETCSFKNVEANVSAKKANAKQDDYPDWLTDTFSFKNVEDTYEDIWPKSQRLNKYDFINMVYPKTPPLKENIDIDPIFLELPQENFFTFHDEFILDEEPIDDIEVPDFDSLTGVTF